VKIFPASLEKLYEMLQFICNRAEEYGFKKADLGHIELAAEEALVNVIQHGYYGKNEGPIEIHCFRTENPGIKIVIKDHGLAFNPLDELRRVKEKGKKTEKGESLGGYGVLLIDQVMDEVNYEYVDGTNTLTLLKRK